MGAVGEISCHLKGRPSTTIIYGMVFRFEICSRIYKALH